MPDLKDNPRADKSKPSTAKTKNKTKADLAEEVDGDGLPGAAQAATGDDAAVEHADGDPRLVALGGGRGREQEEQGERQRQRRPRAFESDHGSSG